MKKTLELEKHQWNKIFARIKKEYPTSVWELRSKMRKVLFFTPREYKVWDENIGKYGGWNKDCIVLDFYSEKHKTLFLMKHSDILNDRTDSNF